MDLNYRPPTKDDWDKIVELSKNQDYQFPEFKDILGCIVVEDSKKVVTGIAVFHRQVEASIMLDFYQPLRVQVNTLKLMYKVSVDKAKEFGLKSFFAFVKDRMHSRILQKHFGFKLSTKDTLYKDIN